MMRQPRPSLGSAGPWTETWRSAQRAC
uniref:Uncharacterized protein n=1 Tax=Anguilla anguilla TaxID=7936 RepID=A0A0E9U8C4_ANGAN